MINPFQDKTATFTQNQNCKKEFVVSIPGAFDTATGFNKTSKPHNQEASPKITVVQNYDKENLKFD